MSMDAGPLQILPLKRELLRWNPNNPLGFSPSWDHGAPVVHRKNNLLCPTLDIQSDSTTSGA